MITRREAVRQLGLASAATWFAAQFGLDSLIAPRASAAAGKDDSTPPLALGAPMSPERLALIEAFKKQSEGLEKKFEPRTHKSDWVMPYRLFRPEAAGKVPLVMYLHGSGGLGDDNLKQLGLGNIFGSRVWLLPENQKHFPCYVVVPQTDRGWIRYDFSQQAQGPPKELPGFGDRSRLAVEIVMPYGRQGSFLLGSAERIVFENCGMLATFNGKRIPKRFQRNCNPFRVPSSFTVHCGVDWRYLAGGVDKYRVTASVLIPDYNPCWKPVPVFIACQGLSSRSDGIPDLQRA
jgi:hypothetical protein